MPFTELLSINSQTIYIWDCRRPQIRPIIAGFKLRINIKFETEKYVCTKNTTLSAFYKNGRAIMCTEYFCNTRSLNFR